MLIARYLLAGLLLVLLVADIAYDRWTERPYIVTAIEADTSDILDWSVRYTTPDGGGGMWRYRANEAGRELIDCLRAVQVGKRVPACLESFALPAPPTSN